MLADVIVGVVIGIFVVLAVRSYFKQRKKGCGGNCAGCSMHCGKDNKNS